MKIDIEKMVAEARSHDNGAIRLVFSPRMLLNLGMGAAD